MTNISKEKIRQQAGVIELRINFELTSDAFIKAGEQGKTLGDVYRAVYIC